MFDRSLPSTIVIFSASEDLTRRKLIPSLYNLYPKKRLPEVTKIAGFVLRPYHDADSHNRMCAGVEEFSGDTQEEGLWTTFDEYPYYFQGNLDTGRSCRRFWETLKEQYWNPIPSQSNSCPHEPHPTPR